MACIIPRWLGTYLKINCITKTRALGYLFPNSVFEQIYGRLSPNAELQGHEIWCLLTVYIHIILGIEWKKVYSIQSTEGLFADLEEAKNKNAYDENADLFSILGELEQFRTCNGDFHFKICFPELVENFSFPCNEWTQFSNPVHESIIRDFQPIKLSFDKFVGLGMSERGKKNNLIDYKPFETNWWFSVGTIEGDDEGRIAGPEKNWVEKVELYVNPGHHFFISNYKDTKIFYFKIMRFQRS